MTNNQSLCPVTGEKKQRKNTHKLTTRVLFHKCQHREPIYKIKNHKRAQSIIICNHRSYVYSLIKSIGPRIIALTAVAQSPATVKLFSPLFIRILFPRLSVKASNKYNLPKLGKHGVYHTLSTHTITQWDVRVDRG